MIAKQILLSTGALILTGHVLISSAHLLYDQEIFLPTTQFIWNFKNIYENNYHNTIM